MNITEAIAATYLASTGKATAPTTGTKYNKILGLLDMNQQLWANEPGVDWNSLYDPQFSIGNVSATDTYDLDSSTIRTLSGTQGDPVIIKWSDGVGETRYDLVDADKLKLYYMGQNKESSFGRYCAQIGSTLVFNHKFTSLDSEYGGEIFVPCYTYPETISSTNLGDDVAVDNPYWLVLASAAEYVRTDLTRQNQYENISAKANQLMQRMMDDNAGQVTDVVKGWTPFSGIGQEGTWS